MRKIITAGAVATIVALSTVPAHAGQLYTPGGLSAVQGTNTAVTAGVGMDSEISRSGVRLDANWQPASAPMFA